MEDLFERFFPDLGQAETALFVIVLAIIAIALWFGRKKLRVMIPVCAAVLLLAAIAIPSAIPARSYAHRAACINNLKLIERAKATWETTVKKGENVILAMTNLVGLVPRFDGELICPSGGKYLIGPVGEKPRCSLEDRGHKLK